MHGKDPRLLHFAGGAMRGHLLACIESGNMEPFPCFHVQPKKRKCCNDIIEVFCTCKTQEGGRMAACSKCGEWYHEECVSLPQRVWTDSDVKWLVGFMHVSIISSVVYSCVI